jgi:hypothetical protein
LRLMVVLAFCTNLLPFLYDNPSPIPSKLAVALGRLGGLKGGKARTAKLTAEQRRELARKAVNARWAKARERAQKKDPQDKT